MKIIIIFVCGIGLLLFPLGTYGQTGKRKIENIDDLPRYPYKVESTASELFADNDAFASFTALVRADIERDLETYDVQDSKTMRSFLGTLTAIDMMDGDYQAALEKTHRIRELHDKMANKLTSGLVTEAMIKAHLEAASSDDPTFRAAFVRYLSQAINELPWNIVQENIEELKGQMDMFSENFVLGMVQSRFDPVVEKAEHISNDIAARLISLRYTVYFQLPLKDEITSVLENYIAANRFEKDDIWQARNIVLSEEDGVHPVVIAIWDTGIDTDVFPDQLFVNENEKINGKDDDLNGFIDDVHGIAYNLEEEKTPEVLYPLGESEERLPELKRFVKGFFDIQSAVESEEAVILKEKMSRIQPEQIRTMFEDLSRIALYSHGTHVAGIAVEGNPFARIMNVRFTIDYQTIPIAPTIDLSRKMAQNYIEAIDYMKAHDVRVVNMSWGSTLRETERDLEANGVGETALERARLAREMFDIEKRALYEAMKNAPDILFVNAAGNENDNVIFEDYYPAAFDLPNLLVVGAVDRAGDVTSFTSFGTTVDVYANGYEVESYLPGGDRLAASGTSAASPNAVNLAAKLFALDPSLTPPEIIALIKNAVEPNSEGLPVMNPKRSVELLRSSDRG